MISEVQIVGLEVFSGIQELSENGKVIGYLIEPNKYQQSTTIVTTEGKTLGEYCCTAHAVKAAFANVRGEKVDLASGFTKYSVLDLLLASLLRKTRH